MNNIISQMVNKFIPFAQERMGFHKPPRLFLRSDSENANNPLGKTAYYDPSQKAVTLYITNRHPKDIMRSLSHELVHHTQNCRGDFNDIGEMGEGYAQNDEHLREMEREAYETGNMCFRDWEDSLKQTIYFEHLQKGENKMSIKDWKNKEIGTLLSEAWGFKFSSLEEFDEFNGSGELQAEGEEELDELAGGRQSRERRKPHQSAKYADEEDDDSTEKNAPAPPRVVNKGKKNVAEAEEPDDDINEEVVEESEKINEEEGVFAPNHYCVHHGGVTKEGSLEMAEAVGHNFNEDLGKVTHYDMKFEDGTIMEGVPFEDIQVTNASLAEGHGHPMKRDDDEEDLDESEELKEAIVQLLKKHLKG
jgi:hypothetical protein